MSYFFKTEELVVLLKVGLIKCFKMKQGGLYDLKGNSYPILNYEADVSKSRFNIIANIETNLIRHILFFMQRDDIYEVDITNIDVPKYINHL